MKTYGEVYFTEYLNEFSKEDLADSNNEDLSRNIYKHKYCEGVKLDFIGSVYLVPDKVDEFKQKLANLVGEFQKEWGV